MTNETNDSANYSFLEFDKKEQNSTKMSYCIIVNLNQN